MTKYDLNRTYDDPSICVSCRKRKPTRIHIVMGSLIGDTQYLDRYHVCERCHRHPNGIHSWQRRPMTPRFHFELRNVFSPMTTIHKVEDPDPVRHDRYQAWQREKSCGPVVREATCRTLLGALWVAWKWRNRVAEKTP